MMIIFLFILAWLLCGFAGAYIGHRWADKGQRNTTLGAVIVMTIFGPLTLFGAVIVGLIDCVCFDKIIFKGKS